MMNHTDSDAIWTSTVDGGEDLGAFDEVASVGTCSSPDVGASEGAGGGLVGHSLRLAIIDAKR